MAESTRSLCGSKKNNNHSSEGKENADPKDAADDTSTQVKQGANRKADALRDASKTISMLSMNRWKENCRTSNKNWRNSRKNFSRSTKCGIRRRSGRRRKLTLASERNNTKEKSKQILGERLEESQRPKCEEIGTGLCFLEQNTKPTSSRSRFRLSWMTRSDSRQISMTRRNILRVNLRGRPSESKSWINRSWYLAPSKLPLRWSWTMTKHVRIIAFHCVWI